MVGERVRKVDDDVEVTAPDVEAKREKKINRRRLKLSELIFTPFTNPRRRSGPSLRLLSLSLPSPARVFSRRLSTREIGAGP